MSFLEFATLRENQPAAHFDRSTNREMYSLCRSGARKTIAEGDIIGSHVLWYAEANAISNAIGYAKFFSGSHDAVIRVYDSAGTVAATQGGGSAPLVLKRAGAV